MNLSQIAELNLDSGKTKFYKKEVLDLYYRVLCNSNSWDLGLGYFSLSSIKLLAYPLAKFILNNEGKMRVYCNERLSENDYNIISEKKVIPINKTNIFDDLNTLYDSLKGNDQELFSQCIAFLIQTDRIEFKVLVCKDSTRGISHHKNSIFKDDNNNTVVLSGSANASEQAFIFNREDTNAFCSFWNEKSSNKTIKTTINEFENTFREGDEDWNILEIDSQELKDKLDEIGFRKIDSLSLDKKAKSFSNSKKNLFSKSIHDEIDKEIKTINDQPHFPIFDGIISKPRKYQIDAYNAWVNNNYSGIFAMATGTGKTITALNCVLEEYKKTKKYQIIIVVPTIDLVNQWKEELEKFNYSNILQVSSKHKWNSEFVRYVQDINYGINNNIAIITTYKSFVNDKFYKLFNKVQEHFTLIADEAHNIGSKEVLKKFKLLKTPRMIALSATPKRNYDPLGTKNIEKIFSDSEPYTYVFSLERAIKEKYLTRYLYYPKIVKLNDDEFEEYKIITKKLIPFMSDEGLEEGAQMLLLKRKRIIHKARNKESVFLEILNELNDKNKLSHAFVFAPEGKYKDNDKNILNSFIKITTDNYSKIRVDSFTSKDTNRADILKSFENGVLDIIFAMKALDEGVDIPRTEVGIFTSSTGNPRQYIQRRGRVLRKHPDKDIAIIYDMIVVPDSFSEETFNIERSLLKQELTRVGYFADLSENYYQAKEVLNKISQDYNLNLDTIITELKNDK